MVKPNDDTSNCSPSDRELQALKILWRLREASVREICDQMNLGADQPLAYTTVLSLLQVMEQKRLVGHKAKGKVYLYFATVKREPTFRNLARGFLDRVFDGAVDEYFLHAMQAKPLSADEIAKLEELIETAKQKSTPTSKEAQP